MHEQKYTSTAPLTLRNYTIKLNQKKKKKKGYTKALWYGSKIKLMVTPRAAFSTALTQENDSQKFIFVEKKSPPDLDIEGGADLVIYRCFRTLTIDCGIQK